MAVEPTSVLGPNFLKELGKEGETTDEVGENINIYHSMLIHGISAGE